MDWDPQVYRRYDNERTRPFHDLLARVGAPAPRRVVDLGCGPATTTALLAARWPGAVVEGIDSSPDMIAAARAVPGVSVRLGDVRQWRAGPDVDVDVVISTATLQWVPGHLELLTQWARALGPGGWLGVQVPGNFAAPAHTLLREHAARFGVGHVLRHHDAVAEPDDYAQLLLDAGLVADVWETTYLHVLAGADPVFEWLRGTGLRPVLAALSADRVEQFGAGFAAALRAAYPPGPGGTLFPFRRIFAVGHRPEGAS
ncbi:MAG TPA: trans-aconitate 2-methyltransferase [Jatrophihabitans sp.]